MLRLLARYSSSATWRAEKGPSIRQLPCIISGLSKARLSAMVVGSMLCNHLLSADTFDPRLIACGIAGTALCSGSAAAFNQWMEIPFDSQMGRTMCRLLPAVHLLPPQAFYGGAAMGVAGVGVLFAAAGDWQPPALALTTILLYSAVYTPLKRVSTWNTAVGAVVGAIPPLIGWSLSGQSVWCASAGILPAILFAWQIPHFNALCWRRRDEYARAGYWMTAVVDPLRNKREALFGSLLLFPLCWYSVFHGMESEAFLATSSAVNGFLAFRAFNFYRQCSPKTCRALFLASLLHLPLLMALLLAHKKPGMPLARAHEET